MVFFREQFQQGAWDKIAEQMLLEFSESGHPTFRATTPLSSVFSRAKGVEYCLYTWLQIKTQLIQFIASISSVSTEHVAAVCEEFESHQDGSGGNLRF